MVLGVVAVCSEGGCRREGLTTGVVRHACRHRVTARGVFALGDCFTCSGAAARGALIFCFGGFFHTLRSGWHERVRGGGFNPLRGATTGVVMRRRATSGEMARGGLVFVFSLEVAPMSEEDSFTRSGVDGTRGLGVGGLIRCAGRPREWSCGAVPPQERWHEGGWFLFFLWRLLRCRRGIVSHAREWSDTHAATE